MQQATPLPLIAIGIDPGREKCGLALVHSVRGVLKIQVVPTSHLFNAVALLSELGQTEIVVIGNGTGANQFLIPLAAKYQLQIVDETHTTELARQRYWQDHPTQGWRRLIPTGLQVPPEPVDGYAAVIIAERWLEQQLQTMS